MLKDIYTYEILVNDLDFVGHVGNIHWMEILQRCQQKYLENIFNLTYRKMRSLKYNLVIIESKLNYYAPSYANDIITISTSLELIDQNSFNFIHKCMNQNGRLSHKARYKIVFISDSNKLQRMPTEIAERIRNSLQKDRLHIEDNLSS